MAEQASTFTALGDTSPVYRLAGPYTVWRGAGDGDVAMEIRYGDAGTWRRSATLVPTGDVLAGDAPYTGRQQQRLVCTRLAAGATIAFAVEQ